MPFSWFTNLTVNGVCLTNAGIPGGYDNDVRTIAGTPTPTAALMANQLCLPTKTRKKMAMMPHKVVPPMHAQTEGLLPTDPLLVLLRCHQTTTAAIRMSQNPYQSS